MVGCGNCATDGANAEPVDRSVLVCSARERGTGVGESSDFTYLMLVEHLMGSGGTYCLERRVDRLLGGVLWVRESLLKPASNSANDELVDASDEGERPTRTIEDDRERALGPSILGN